MFERYYYERAVGEHRTSKAAGVTGDHYVLQPDAEGGSVAVGNKLIKHQGGQLVCSVVHEVLVTNRTS